MAIADGQGRMADLTRLAPTPASTAGRGRASTLMVVVLILVGVVVVGVPVVAMAQSERDAAPVTGSLPDGHVGTHAVPLAGGDAFVLAGSHDGSVTDTSYRWRSERNEFEHATDLLEPRVGPGVTLLKDGDVLVSGGMGRDGAARTTAEILSTEGRVTEPTGALNQARAIHSSTLLPDGRVLVVGGVDAVADEMSTLASAELWDRASGQFSVVGSLEEPRYGHTATALPDGRVAVIGGVAFTGEGIRFAETIELWDPDVGEFTTVAQYPRDAINHTATLLGDGRILIVGGITAAGAEVSDEIEVWNPIDSTVVPAATLRGPRAQHAATLLENGSVLVIGGQGLAGPVAMAETWDSDAGTADAPIELRWPRSTPAVVALSDGRLLIVGGFGNGSYLSAYEVWTLATDGIVAVESTGGVDDDH